MYCTLPPYSPLLLRHFTASSRRWGDTCTCVIYARAITPHSLVLCFAFLFVFIANCVTGTEYTTCTLFHPGNSEANWANILYLLGRLAEVAWSIVLDERDFWSWYLNFSISPWLSCSRRMVTGEMEKFSTQLPAERAAEAAGVRLGSSRRCQSREC